MMGLDEAARNSTRAAAMASRRDAESGSCDRVAAARRARILGKGCGESKTSRPGSEPTFAPAARFRRRRRVGRRMLCV